ncbi:MAG: pectinesterase family protein [Oribacterium sp.]|nr:pectinesterase family protein [Oribacterium sp.]
MITVAKKNGDYASVQAAVDAVAAKYEALTDEEKEAWQGETIHIAVGVYEEQVEVHVPKLHLIGENLVTEQVDRQHTTVITGSLYGKMPREDIGKLGTFRTYTMLVDAPDVCIENLTIENTAGFGLEIGQAVALYADAEHFHAKNVFLLGHQDTLFTGPLPEKEREVNGFFGPRVDAPRVNTHQWYESCYIEGNVDFIFGSASALFEHCTLFQLGPYGYLTAGSQRAGQPVGYVFSDCQILGDAAPGSSYLGRPWRDDANASFIHCYLGEQLSPVLFHPWKTTMPEATRYAVYDCYGPAWHPDHKLPTTVMLNEITADRILAEAKKICCNR